MEPRAQNQVNAATGVRMRVKAVGWIFLLACFMMAMPSWAQEGFPLSGSWHGDWGPTPTQRNHVTMFMKWDTKNIVGTINPGPHAIPMTVATLDPNNWTVHFEGDGKDKAGNPVHVVVDGKLEDIGSYHRTITGTWKEGSTQGDFKVTRD